MLVGGLNSESAAWVYSWETEAWTTTGPLQQGRLYHSCVEAAGSVLVAGGWDAGLAPVQSVEHYDPVTGIWSYMPDLPESIAAPVALQLLHGEGGPLALFFGLDRVYRQNEEGEWGALAGIHLPELFDGYDVDKAVLVPETFALGCL